MAIQYNTRQNKLLDDGSYCAYVIPTGVLDQNALINAMVDMGSTLTKTDITAALTLMTETLKKFLILGYSINLPLINLHTSIRGKFNDPTESFSKSNHLVVVKSAMGTAFKTFNQEVEVKKKEVIALIEPVIEAYYNNTSQAINSGITGGDYISIKGKRLNFDKMDPNQGLFVNDAKIDVVKVSPSEVLFEAPIAAVYKIVIKKKHLESMITSNEYLVM